MTDNSSSTNSVAISSASMPVGDAIELMITRARCALAEANDALSSHRDLRGRPSFEAATPITEARRSVTLAGYLRTGRSASDRCAQALLQASGDLQASSYEAPIRAIGRGLQEVASYLDQFPRPPEL